MAVKWGERISADIHEVKKSIKKRRKEQFAKWALVEGGRIESKTDE